MRLWLRYALRDLRAGLQGFWIFLACLVLGTGTIAIVGALAASLSRGLDEQGQTLLGGDIEFALIHRQTNADEQAFLVSRGQVGRSATLRAMAIADQGSTLAELKSVDGAYPLYGSFALEGGGALQDALRNNGAVADPLLLSRLGLKVGDTLRVGTATLNLRGVITSEPDRLSEGFLLGPRLLISEDTLNATGLIQPGSLITWDYRVKLVDPAKAKSVMKEAREKFPDAGWRVRGKDNAAQGTDRFIQRLGYFMTLVGLASLIVGGAGIANAVAAFVSRKTSAIATLKCLGGTSRDVFAIYLIEILLVGLIAIAGGVALGMIVPPLMAYLLEGILPLPVTSRIEPWPLAVAALFGFLVTLAFSLWPLARVRRVPASALFRHRALPVHGWPSWKELLAIALSLALIGGVAMLNSPQGEVTGWYLLGLLVSFIVLLGLAQLIVRGAKYLPRPRAVIWRYALSNIYRPGAASVSVIMALGLGLTLFVMLALTDRTISGELSANLPEKAPAFFFADVQSADLARLTDELKSTPGVTAITAAPMLRGRITAVKGVEAEKVKPKEDGAWALRGDRGLTYSETLPDGSTLKEGTWWPAGYAGPPLVSLTSDIADALGLKLGDPITVNVLGREMTATVSSLREVNWKSLGMNFVLVFSPNTLKGAPHANIVTVQMTGGDEAKLLNSIARDFPTVTAVRVKDVIAQVSGLLGKMLAAIRGANLLTLLTGVLVLAGALAAGLSERVYDAVVLKTYGASRHQLMSAFALEYAGLGLAAAVFGVAVGSLASWFLAYYILEMDWRFSTLTAALTALIAMAVTVIAGLSVTWVALAARPARQLRDE